MARLNAATRTHKMRDHPNATLNQEGGLAFSLSPENELYTRVLTCLVAEPKFYDPNGAEHLVAIQRLVAQLADGNDPEYILKLAMYARNVMNLRTIPVLLLAMAAEYEGTRSLVRRWTPQILTRADQPAEALAAWKHLRGINVPNISKTIPNGFRRGIGDALNQFDAYQLGKYKGSGSNISLRDVIKMVHPTPNSPEQSALFKAVLDGTLKAPNTWEVNISGKGSTKETWEESIPNMGYMALLRNLRNFLEKGVDIKPVLDVLTDPERVRKSRQLPFRFYSAWAALDRSHNQRHAFSAASRSQLNPIYSQKAKDALQVALELSVDNLPRIPGATAIWVDTSGSMGSRISDRSVVSMAEVASMLGAIAHKLCEDWIVGAFATEPGIANISAADGVLTNMTSIIRVDTHGQSTEAWKTVRWMISNKIDVDRIILLSDMQCYNNIGWSRGSRALADEIVQYRNMINHDTWLYSIDLGGYGTSQLPENDSRTVLLAGWSEKVLKFIEVNERDHSSAIAEIKSQEVIQTT